MKKYKVEILSVIRNTDDIENAQGDGKTRAIFTVKYRVRANKMLALDREEVLFAEDELSAYNLAKQLVKERGI